MQIYSSVVTCLLLISVVNNASAEDFPKAPPNQKAAEAGGLQRVNIEDLKKVIPGTINNEGVKGVKHTLTFKPDGTVDRTGFNDLSGEWHFDKKQNAYCAGYYKKKGYREKCFSVYRSADGNYFFDYEVGSGFYQHVWKPE